MTMIYTAAGRTLLAARQGLVVVAESGDGPGPVSAVLGDDEMLILRGHLTGDGTGLPDPAKVEPQRPFLVRCDGRRWLGLRYPIHPGDPGQAPWMLLGLTEDSRPSCRQILPGGVTVNEFQH